MIFFPPQNNMWMYTTIQKYEDGKFLYYKIMLLKNKIKAAFI